MSGQTYEGNLVVGTERYAILVSRWNDLITSRLMEGSIDTILRHGGKRDQIDIIWAPGAYELPLVSQRLATSGKYAAVISLACVILVEPHTLTMLLRKFLRGLQMFL